MKKLYWKQLQGKLQGFTFAAIKEVTNDDRPLRTVAMTLDLHDCRTLSCWTDDTDFISKNQEQPLPIMARFINKEKGEYILCKGESSIAARSTDGALLHIRIEEQADCYTR